MTATVRDELVRVVRPLMPYYDPTYEDILDIADAALEVVRAQVQALPVEHSWSGVPGYVRRDDVLALLDGGSDD